MNGDAAYGAGWEDALGLGEVEGAGFIEAVGGIDAADPGEDAALFFEGEKGDFGGRGRIRGLRTELNRRQRRVCPLSK